MRLRIYFKDGDVITIHPEMIDAVMKNDKPLTELIGTDEVVKIEVEVE